MALTESEFQNKLQKYLESFQRFNEEERNCADDEKEEFYKRKNEVSFEFLKFANEAKENDFDLSNYITFKYEKNSNYSPDLWYDKLFIYFKYIPDDYDEIDIDEHEKIYIEGFGEIDIGDLVDLHKTYEERFTILPPLVLEKPGGKDILYNTVLNFTELLHFEYNMNDLKDSEYYSLRDVYQMNHFQSFFKNLKYFKDIIPEDDFSKYENELNERYNEFLSQQAEKDGISEPKEELLLKVMSGILSEARDEAEEHGEEDIEVNKIVNLRQIFTQVFSKSETIEKKNLLYIKQHWEEIATLGTEGITIESFEELEEKVKEMLEGPRNSKKEELIDETTSTSFAAESEIKEKKGLESSKSKEETIKQAEQREAVLKRISVEEALEKKLLYESSQGLTVYNISEIDFSQIPKEKLEELLKGIDTPSVLVDADEKIVSRKCYEEIL